MLPTYSVFTAIGAMPPGHVIDAGQKPGNGTTDYAWFIWQIDYDGKPEIGWLRRDA